MRFFARPRLGGSPPWCQNPKFPLPPLKRMGSCNFGFCPLRGLYPAGAPPAGAEDCSQAHLEVFFPLVPSPPPLLFPPSSSSVFLPPLSCALFPSFLFSLYVLWACMGLFDLFWIPHCAHHKISKPSVGNATQTQVIFRHRIQNLPGETPTKSQTISGQKHTKI